MGEGGEERGTFMAEVTVSEADTERLCRPLMKIPLKAIYASGVNMLTGFEFCLIAIFFRRHSYYFFENGSKINRITKAG